LSSELLRLRVDWACTAALGGICCDSSAAFLAARLEVNPVVGTKGFLAGVPYRDVLMSNFGAGFLNSEAGMNSFVDVTGGRCAVKPNIGLLVARCVLVSDATGRSGGNLFGECPRIIALEAGAGAELVGFSCPCARALVVLAKSPRIATGNRFAGVAAIVGPGISLSCKVGLNLDGTVETVMEVELGGLFSFRVLETSGILLWTGLSILDVAFAAVVRGARLMSTSSKSSPWVLSTAVCTFGLGDRGNGICAATV